MVLDLMRTPSEIVLRYCQNRPRQTSSSFCITTSESRAACFKTNFLFIWFYSVAFCCRFRQGFNSHVLRFRAKMISRIPGNEERQFIIRVFLMDDTISIFELAKRNSGIPTNPGSLFINIYNIYKRFTPKCILKNIKKLYIIVDFLLL